MAFIVCGNRKYTVFNIEEKMLMNKSLSELTRNELFAVLLCGERPKEGFTLNDYAKEWNLRVEQEGGFEISASD